MPSPSIFFESSSVWSADAIKAAKECAKALRLPRERSMVPPVIICADLGPDAVRESRALSFIESGINIFQDDWVTRSKAVGKFREAKTAPYQAKLDLWSSRSLSLLQQGCTFSNPVLDSCSAKVR
jgi:hypothetical protein